MNSVTRLGWLLKASRSPDLQGTNLYSCGRTLQDYPILFDYIGARESRLITPREIDGKVDDRASPDPTAVGGANA